MYCSYMIRCKIVVFTSFVLLISNVWNSWVLGYCYLCLPSGWPSVIWDDGRELEDAITSIIDAPNTRTEGVEEGAKEGDCIDGLGDNDVEEGEGGGEITVEDDEGRKEEGGEMREEEGDKEGEEEEDGKKEEEEEEEELLRIAACSIAINDATFALFKTRATFASREAPNENKIREFKW